MNRRHIPAFGMVAHRQESLRAEGFVVMPLADLMLRQPEQLRPHYHDFFQVSLLRGKGSLMHDFREKEVDGLTLFFLSPGQVHTVKPGSLEGTIISFSREFFDGGSPAATQLLLDLPFYASTQDVVPWLSLDPKTETEIPELFSELQNEYDRAESAAAEMLRSWLRVLLIKAGRRHAAQSMAPRAKPATTLVRGFQLAVEKHFHEWAVLAPYARDLGVSVNHLNDVISDATGRAAGEHVRLRRLLAAKRELLHSELSVSEIGYRLGFKDPSYFTRFFRRYEKQTPAAFRTRSREKYQRDTA